jgi:hypothetical protein
MSPCAFDCWFQAFPPSITVNLRRRAGGIKIAVTAHLILSEAMPVSASKHARGN